MHYKQGTPRNQLTLFNECIDEMIAADSYVRVIDAYVESLSLEELGFKMHQLKTGTPPYRNQVILKIYIYGYLDRERSSRRLEKACQRNKEMIWLTEGLTPDFKTIADFRKNNRNGIKEVFKAFLEFCNKVGLISFETIAVDSTTMRAQNSVNSSFKRKNIKKLKRKIRQRIEEYLDELDVNDEKEAFNLKIENTDIAEVIEKINNLKKYEQSIDEAQKEFDEDEDLQTYFAADHDCSFQSDKGKVRPGYNVQTAGDAKHKLITVSDVTGASNDLKQMTPMVSKIQEVKTELNIEQNSDVIMDAGYFSEQEIVNNHEAEGVTIFVSDKKEAEKSNQKRRGNKNVDKVPAQGYELKDFKYNNENDIYFCPNGKPLKKTHSRPGTERSGRKTFEYQCDPDDCDNCGDRQYCTKNKRGRSIHVSVNKDFMDAFKESMKTQENIKIIAKRKEIIEHPFGTLKRTLGYTYFMQKGIENVRSEFNFMCFIYNFKRVLSILTPNGFLEAISKYS
ncbi:MAG: IS1182 family transposase [Clostridiales bacterium]|nr:IS1182 family transposase [Clostridiales bacterium]